jgi:tetratricopeptide (TPR) repeat protein
MLYKTVVLMFIVVTTLFANYFESGLNSYKNGEFERAYSLFSEAFFEDMQSPDRSLYLGLSAVETRRFREALIAFDRVLLLQENNYRAELEIGRVHYLQGNLKEAKKRFQKILKLQPPDVVREKIEAFLLKIEAIENRNSFLTTLSIGYGYESNPNLSTDDVEAVQSYIDESSSLDGVSVEKASEMFYNLHKVSTVHNYRGSSFSINNSIFLYHQNYSGGDENDLLYLSGTSTFQKSIGGFLSSLSLSADKVNYEDSGLLNSYSAGLSTQKNLWKMRGELSYLYRDNRFIEKRNRNRDSIENQVGFKLIKPFKKSLLNGEIIYLSENGIESDSGLFVDRNEYRFNLGYTYRFTRSQLNLLYSFKFVDFSDVVADGEKRQDFYSSYRAVYRVPISDEVWINTAITYTDNITDYLPLQYSNTIAEININFKL